jgi:hypothetical protein
MRQLHRGPLRIVITLLAMLCSAQSKPVDVECDSPLKGVSSHDFGRVWFNRKAIELEHRFVLQNKSSEPVTIEKVSSSCGCAVGNVQRSQLQAGEQTEVSVRLRLSQPGPQSESVWLNLGDRGIHELKVSAIAKVKGEFYCLQRAVAVRPGKDATLVLVATRLDNGQAPPDPEFIPPEHVTVRFGGWQLIHESDQAIGRPARWQALIYVAGGRELRQRTSMLIRSKTGDEIKVDLTGWPW